MVSPFFGVCRRAGLYVLRPLGVSSQRRLLDPWLLVRSAGRETGYRLGNCTRIKEILSGPPALLAAWTI
jgi:hypothetical protein